MADTVKFGYRANVFIGSSKMFIFFSSLYKPGMTNTANNSNVLGFFKNINTLCSCFNVKVGIVRVRNTH